MSQRNIRVAENPEMNISEINQAICGYGYDSTAAETDSEARLNKFLRTLSAKSDRMNNLTFTENGALAYKSSGSALVDFNARATELRHADHDALLRSAQIAYAENPLLSVKLFFQTGDIRSGKGERNIFNACMDFLADSHPAVALEVLPLIPEYTRWDYLIRLATSENSGIAKAATRLVCDQFHADSKAVHSAKEGESVHISLLAKWMPSLQTKKAEHRALVRHFLKALHMNERDYRHVLSKLRACLNIIEKSMSAKNCDAIDMEKMTAKQQLRYSAFLQRVMAEKRHAYIQAVLRGEAKMNASVLNPVDIMHEYAQNRWESFTYNEDMEALWSLLPDHMTGNGSTLVVRDGSGSMTSPIGASSTATMLEAATAMTVYCAERLSGPFQDKFITFSRSPRLLDLSGCKNLLEKITLIYAQDECSNTDIEATFDLILDTAVSGNMKQEDLPSYLLILSDMEFDTARGAYSWDKGGYVSGATLFETIRKKWIDAGYQVPTLVFWNLNGHRTTFPEISSENGVIYLSGFSTNELSMVMAGEYEKLCEIVTEETVTDEETGEEITVRKATQEKVILSPWEQLLAKLSKERYDAVEAAVKRGLAKEQKGKQTAS